MVKKYNIREYWGGDDWLDTGRSIKLGDSDNIASLISKVYCALDIRLRRKCGNNHRYKESQFSIDWVTPYGRIFVKIFKDTPFALLTPVVETPSAADEISVRGTPIITTVLENN